MNNKLKVFKFIVVVQAFLIFNYSSFAVENSFNKLPQDLRNYEIRSFLDPKARMNLAMTNQENFKSDKKIPGFIIPRTRKEKLCDNLIKATTKSLQYYNKCSNVMGCIDLSLIVSLQSLLGTIDFDGEGSDPVCEYLYSIRNCLIFSGACLMASSMIADHTQKRLENNLTEREQARIPIPLNFDHPQSSSQPAR